MSNYALYCQTQAAECARRARLAKSPEVIAHFRELGLQGVRLAQKECGGRLVALGKEQADSADPRRALRSPRRAATIC
jgi:hypothetical protein